MIVGIFCAVLTCYVLLILSLMYGFWKLPKIKQQHIASTVDFSVIIPFRNEATHLPKLLQSIAHLKYPIPKMTFWFVDDASEDDSCKIIEQFRKEHSTFNIYILQNKRVSNSPKKDAITTAISQIQSDWIITTDADCMLPMNWLAFFNQEIAIKQPKMIAAPVTYQKTTSFFSYFQLLDFLSLQGTTMGSFGLQLPFMCNGANLAYQKEAFLEVHGFSGNDTIASGDDVFLLEKFIQKWPKKVVYLKTKSALVHTYAVNTFKELVSQRMRWASKSANYTLLRGKLIGVLVLLMNLLFCILPCLVFTSVSWKFLLCVAVLKILIDSFLLAQTLHFTQQKFKFFYFLFSTLLYPFFTIFIFLKSLVSTYTWKNRVFKK
ncbi:glycosyltransferase [Kordia algicida OT-1]|uniref:B-glycosyltransferase-related protein, glycosyltransferase family 2 protein n=1 Tax=Kordia algicida OT-1 TaxID=391587 RepID=A9DJS5_9FLAO|nr:glycosyltransferase [Kordia algicida]EDP98173.1 b-glycosyltransferase-related protein, glycosyltransferase family 2 protein [Kordia algicida OT-1]